MPINIEFIEDQNEGYAPRTKVNAGADVTIAFAVDFTTAGEKLTKRCVKEQRKLYIPITPNIFTLTSSVIKRVANKIREAVGDVEFTLNIAGNGLYTMRNRYDQPIVNQYVTSFIKSLNEELGYKIKSIRSGGQTGFDEAGLMAAQSLDIKAICLAPKGWKFRNTFGQDISDEWLFKQRFIK